MKFYLILMFSLFIHYSFSQTKAKICGDSVGAVTLLTEFSLVNFKNVPDTIIVNPYPNTFYYFYVNSCKGSMDFEMRDSVNSVLISGSYNPCNNLILREYCIFDPETFKEIKGMEYSGEPLKKGKWRYRDNTGKLTKIEIFNIKGELINTKKY